MCNNNWQQITVTPDPSIGIYLYLLYIYYAFALWGQYWNIFMGVCWRGLVLQRCSLNLTGQKFNRTQKNCLGNYVVLFSYFGLIISWIQVLGVYMYATHVHIVFFVQSLNINKKRRRKLSNIVYGFYVISYKTMYSANTF